MGKMIEAFRNILVLSMIALAVAGGDLTAKETCQACNCQNKACRLDVYEDMEKTSLIDLVDFIQNTLDGIDQDNCKKCDTCENWAYEHCKTFTDSRGEKMTVNYANLKSADPSKELCCTERHIETPAPTPPRIETCKTHWDCELTCNRKTDETAWDSRVLNCQSCCLETCEDWQPFHYCPLSQCGIKQANVQNLPVVVDMADFDANCEKCCQAVTPAPTPPGPTCEEWAPDNCIKNMSYDKPSSDGRLTSCPKGRVLNQNNLNSTILDCNTCTQPTCQDFDCSRYNMGTDPSKQCEVNLHHKTCCKPTCKYFNCHDFHKLQNEKQENSTIISHENCCKPTCETWNFEFSCHAPNVYDQSKSKTPLPKDPAKFEEEGREACCGHVCNRHVCPPGLDRCTDAELEQGTCSDYIKYPKQVLQNHICDSPSGARSVGCLAMNKFWHYGVGVWECCKCAENKDLLIPGIPVWDDKYDHKFHCMQLPKEERHSYCPDIRDKWGKLQPACRVTIGSTNFCHMKSTLAVDHPYLKCDDKWDGGVNSNAAQYTPLDLKPWNGQ